MERKQTSFDSVNETLWREKISASKREFRSRQQKLSFNEKMQIAFALSERDSKLKEAKKK